MAECEFAGVPKPRPAYGEVFGHLPEPVRVPTWAVVYSRSLIVKVPFCFGTPVAVTSTGLVMMPPVRWNEPRPLG